MQVFLTHVLSALKFREWIGGEEKLNKYCHDLAISGGNKLAELLGTQVMDKDGEFTANMVGPNFFSCPLFSPMI